MNTTRPPTIGPLISTVSVGPTSPTELFKKFKGHPFSVLFDGTSGGWFEGGFSLLGGGPFAIFQSKGNTIRFDYLPKGHAQTFRNKGDPIQQLQMWLDRFHASPPGDTEIPFLHGGVAGFFSYDLVRQFESIPPQAYEDPDVPDIYLIFLNSFLVYEHKNHVAHIVYNPDPEINMGEDTRIVLKRAHKVMASIQRQIEGPYPVSPALKTTSPLVIRPHLTAQDYMKMVRRSLEYISAGDIFQANLSHRFSAEASDLSTFLTYQRLQQINPSPFAAYMNLGDIQIVSGSPERLVRVNGERVETWPIAGTQRRGRDTVEDEKMVKALCTSEKERAEHLMLVDLERNDLGRVCQYGSVKVRSLMEIEKYSHVIHWVTRIGGHLIPGTRPLQVIRALFPGGTITGVPKIRCMEIISELEKEARGIYTGSIGYISFSGEMDMNIAIRTLIKKGDRIMFQVGSGIVADSDPEAEYQETLNKAAALIKALEAPS